MRGKKFSFRYKYTLKTSPSKRDGSMDLMIIRNLYNSQLDKTKVTGSFSSIFLSNFKKTHKGTDGRESTLSRQNEYLWIEEGHK